MQNKKSLQQDLIIAEDEEIYKKFPLVYMEDNNFKVNTNDVLCMVIQSKAEEITPIHTDKEIQLENYVVEKYNLIKSFDIKWRSWIDNEVIKMRKFDYTEKWKKLLTPEIVGYLTTIHEYKGEQRLIAEHHADV